MPVHRGVPRSTSIPLIAASISDPAAAPPEVGALSVIEPADLEIGSPVVDATTAAAYDLAVKPKPQASPAIDEIVQFGPFVAYRSADGSITIRRKGADDSVVQKRSWAMFRVPESAGDDEDGIIVSIVLAARSGPRIEPPSEVMTGVAETTPAADEAPELHELGIKES